MIESVGVPLNLIDLGPWGILTVAVALVLLGLYRRKLVPEKDLLDEQAEKASWRAAYERSEEARREADKQISTLINAVAENNQLGRTTVAMLQALRDKAET